MARIFALALAAALASLGAPDAPGQAAPDPFAREIRPLLAKYCAGCHGPSKPKADLNLEAFRDEAAALKSRKVWRKVYDALHSDEMPPADKPQPTPAERERITDWAEALLTRPLAGGKRDPGAPVLRRLNRIEYNNTVADLFRLFRPPRGRANYFDPAKGALPESIRLVAGDYQPNLLVDLPADDLAYGYNTVGEALSLPPFLVERYLRAAAQVVEKADAQIRGMLRAGSGADRDKARAFLSSFAPRAYRRPTAPAEIDRLLAFYDQAAKDGEALENAIKVPLQAILVSPDFLLKVEKDGPRDDPGGVRPLTGHELATRLSYFLWSTMPDEELSRLADQGKLQDVAVLEAQARRMLRSPKAKELSDTFAMQWLQLDALEAIMPDPVLFPVFYQGDMPRAMRIEAILLFETILVEDRTILDFLDADYTYVFPPLAKFYGIDAGGGKTKGDWRRVKLPDKRRGGVLTMAAVLAVTSSNTRTNPVKRGKWLLETILGAPPPPPLPGVGVIPDEPTPVDGPTVRRKLEQHRADPRCASCHKRIDPLGLALENYDPLGAWREKDGSTPVDASAVLPDGTAVNGAAELKKLLLSTKSGDFVRCLTEHLMTYALGRKVDLVDQASVKEIVQAAEKDGHRFSRLIVEIVKSYPFRHRRNKGVVDE